MDSRVDPQVKKNMNSIDLFKFVMAICVVAIHTNPLINCGNPVILEVYTYFVGLAVPFFFITTGYLLGLKLSGVNQGDCSPVIRQLKKTIHMYVVWSVIYFPLAVAGFVQEKSSLLNAIFRYARGFFLIGENYNSWPLWYLLSTIYSLLLILLLMKHNVSTRKIVGIGFCIISLSFFLDWLVAYNNQLPVFFRILRTGIKKTILSGRILRGMFFIPFGMLISHKVPSMRFGFCVLFLGFLLDRYATGMASEYTFILRAIGFFCIVINIHLKDAKMYRFFRGISTDMYVWHMWIWTIYYMLVYGQKTYGMDSFLVTTVLCTAFSVILTLLKYKRLAQKAVQQGNAT